MTTLQKELALVARIKPPPYSQLSKCLRSQMIKLRVHSGAWGMVGGYEFTLGVCHLFLQCKMFTLQGEVQQSTYGFSPIMEQLFSFQLFSTYFGRGVIQGKNQKPNSLRVSDYQNMYFPLVGHGHQRSMIKSSIPDIRFLET